MRLLLNKNISGTVAHALREHGHDVLWAKESMRSEKDVVILVRAQTESRLVVTQDKDFGELAFRYGLPADCGVILFRLFRLTGVGAESDRLRMLEVIESGTDWTGQFVVATDDRVRIRPLPSRRAKPK